MAIIKGTTNSDSLNIQDANADLVLGLAGNDNIDVITDNGDEIVSGGLGDDELFVKIGDRAFGDYGNDTLTSDPQGDVSSANRLFGGSGNDILFPDQDDLVSGGSGNDTLYAGRGGNTLRGGLGNDVFWLANAERPTNPNRITDFNPIEDTLRINLEGVQSFNDLVITADGNHVVINTTNSTVPLATIENIQPEDLTANNVLIDNNAGNNTGIAPLDDKVRGAARITFIGQDLLDDNGLTTDNQGRIQFLDPVTGNNTTVGGLSGITYDPVEQVYHAISDDRSNINPARFYSLTIDLSDGSLNNGDVSITRVTSLLDENGDPFAANSLDPEGIAWTDNGTVFVSSEGDANNSIAPFVREFSLAGGQLQNFVVPEKFLPQANQGIRNNLAFESLTLTPDQRFLFTATENALIQDGETANATDGSFVRIIQYDLTGTVPQVVKEFLYQTDAIPPVDNSNSVDTNGLVDLVAIDNTGSLLTLERAFTAEGGYSGKIYEIRLQNSPDISNLASVSDADITPVSKRLLFDLSTLDIQIDNIEGMTLGPVLPNGKRSLIIVSDDNFDSFGPQNNQILAFEINIGEPPVFLNDALPDLLERSPAGTIVGNVLVDDPDSDDDLLTYAITGGNLDLDDDGNPAFVIDSSTGQVQVNDSDDIDIDRFEQEPKFDLEITVIDADGITNTGNIAIDLKPQFGFEKNQDGKNGLFRLRGDTTIELTVNTVSTNQTNEILMFTVDDANGNIFQRDNNGNIVTDNQGNPILISPDNLNYLTQIIANHRFTSGLTQVAFSVLASDNPSGLPSGFSVSGLSRALEFGAGTRLGFMLIADGTVQELQNGLTRQVFFSNLNGVEVENFPSADFRIKFKDRSTGAFDALVLQIKEQPPGLMKKGTALQMQSGLEVIDLRGEADSLVRITVNNEAAFSNFVGFYAAVNEQGGIRRANGTIALPGDSDYTQLAVNQRLNVSITKSANVINNVTLTGDSILVPFIVANDDNLSNGFDISQVYFPFLGANSDRSEHIRLLGDNVFGFEDLPNGGDRDFDDMIIQIDFIA
ncbi:esterase-like activity of phytase family protein [Anabaena sp. 4-3]|uniref:esterase-like activity of phytase family protein n=1 Tax=Anabaena sp. 4-3 TaxID=1811979 RepID=UPI0008365974|nr:esterase-like activity of phytase family protein [Anabaena sp. 4-3]